MASLSDMSSEEFVDTASQLISNKDNLAGKKIIEKVMKDKFDNEINRIKVQGRFVKM